MGETEAKGASGCSRARFLTWFVVAQLLAQIGAFAFLYSYVKRLEYEMRTGSRCEECAVGDILEETVPSNINYPDDELEPEISRQKRSGLLLEDNAVSEIFKIREEKEVQQQQQQRDVKKATASPVGPPIGSVEEPPILPGSQDWVWLTADTRIPVDAIENFCRSSRDYCPPGPPGLPGVQGIPGPPGAPGSSGPSGDRGLPGLPGVSGPVGPPGLTGFPGARGPKGEMGGRGLDGRDGIPGEPGLDGVPGRSGVDGIAGRDGTPGLNGIPGRPGRNGTDGKQGPRGPPGPPGAQGPQGIAGPRGYKGKPGVNGTNGIPGVKAYSVRLANGTDSSELLIPPTILGNGGSYRVITVTESSNVRLRCAASGNPAPTIQWSRVGSAAVELGNWSMTSVTDRTLNITVVNRIHMGEYICHADNGIPPTATQTYRLEVHFPPLIRIRNQMVGARLRGIAILECEIEAFPEAVTYWERGDGRLLENSDKYRINLIEKKDGYKAKMQLNITNITTADHSFYHCICKNEMGITRGVFTVYEITRRPPSGSVEQQQVVIYGERPPERKDLDDLCPAAPRCDTCPKCSLFYDAAVSRPDIRPIAGEIRYTYFPPRTLDCLLYAVGKPVYHRFTDYTLHGCWMRDSSPRTDAAGEKLWVTKETDTKYLYEYNNKTVFRKDHPRKIELPYRFKGNGHVVYNGCFFYNPEGRPSIIRFDISSGNGERNVTKELELPGLDYNSTNYLYTPRHNFNYVDFNVDDNGLWVIYACRSTNNTVVMKIDALLMLPQHSWNISMNHHKFGEMFIVCGVLYAVDSVTERTTKIRLALDLYKNISLEVNLSFSNPFRKTTMIGYNHKNKELFTWDKGNQLTYPIRYHEIGYNMTKEEARDMEPVAQMRTGFDVSNNKAYEDSGY